MAERPSLDFNQIKVGSSKLQNDVVAQINEMTRAKFNKPFRQKDVFQAVDRHDLPELRRMSNLFFDKSGVYSRLCRYVAYLYRYDWFVTPVWTDKSVKEEKVVEGWYKACQFLDNCGFKKEFGEIALKVVKNGCYYGYRIQQKTAEYLQELPVDYCRSRYELNGRAAVEFNIKFFDDKFKDAQYRMKVLKMFPKEFQKAYIAYKNGTLAKDYSGDDRGWFLLDPEMTVKFNLSNTDMPLFTSVIPAILDLEDAQDMNKKKMAQQLMKVIIQKMPLDKNYNLVFDMVETQTLHNNAVQMLGNAIGVDILTTFADVEVADLSDNGNVSSTDRFEKIKDNVYDEAGVSQMQFNTSGNLALEKSIANDAATVSDLVLQFQDYMNLTIKAFNKNPRRLYYKASILPTTIYNYRDLAQTYKEQSTIGFSKLLPQVALGMSQVEIISTAVFENQIMDLNSLFVPPQMSSTMSGSGEAGGDGRPELPDDEKAEGTIDHIENGDQ